MRTHRGLGGLVLAAILASPVLAGIGLADEPIAFAPVPDPVGVGHRDDARVLAFHHPTPAGGIQWACLVDGTSVERAAAEPAPRRLAGIRGVRCVAVSPLRPHRDTRSVAPVLRPAQRQRVVSAGRYVVGSASWYCGHGSRCTRGYPGGLYAAAGPTLRTGDWRGRRVVVSVLGRSVTVRLIDWCACPQRTLDLYRDAFSRLADPSRGLIRVTVSW
jgi:hypothetical protein